MLCGVVVSLDSRAQRAAAFPYLLAARSTVGPGFDSTSPAASSNNASHIAETCAGSTEKSSSRRSLG